MIVVIDYGLGNLTSVYNALSFLGAKAKISQLPEDVLKAERLVLPGVGAFGDAMLGLEKRGLAKAIKESIASGKIYLGICLGLQVLFEKSEEGKEKGLGIFKGKVTRFQEKDSIKVPQIGWNRVNFRDSKETRKFTKGVKNNSYFYFDHSYYGIPEDKSIIAGSTDYGVTFGSMLCKDNIYAAQFHPERSQNLGLKILENFVNI